MDGVDLRLLQVFCSVVEAGGLAAAQAELGLSLSTVSGHLAELERRMGFRLCRRGRTGFALTEEGSTVYEEARRLFAGVENFERRARGLRDRMGGTLALGLVDNTLTDPRARVDRVIARYCKAAPQVTLSLVTRPPNELLSDLVAGNLHVAIASFPRVALGLAYDDLYIEQHLLYCGSEHPLFEREDDSLDVAEIRTHRIVSRAYWEARDLKPFGLSVPGAIVSDMEAEARLILSGAFLGYLPEHYASRLVAEGRLRALRPSRFRYAAPFQAAYDRHVAERPTVSLLLRLVREELCTAIPDLEAP